jgi:endoglucanase
MPSLHAELRAQAIADLAQPGRGHQTQVPARVDLCRLALAVAIQSSADRLQGTKAAQRALQRHPGQPEQDSVATWRSDLGEASVRLPWASQPLARVWHDHAMSKRLGGNSRERSPELRASAILIVLVLSLLLTVPVVSSAHSTRRRSCAADSVPAARNPTASAVRLQETAPLMFRINQVGYLRSCPKLALVMARQARLGPRFDVLTGSGRVVYRGRAAAPMRWNSSYLVYRLQFGAVDAPGTYVLRFAGHRSPRLRVGSGRSLYRPLADAVLSFLQSQRDGPDVIAGAMRRQPAHLADTAAQVYRTPTYRGTTLVGRLVPTGSQRDVSGGWFDAGDYLKFIYTASFTDTLLLYTARDYPTGVSDPQALLAEARHGTDWLLKMWDPNQRVLYFQVGIGDGNSGSIEGDHDLWRLPQADNHGPASPSSPTYFATHRPVFAANAPGAPISPNLAGRVAASFGLCAQVFAQSDPAYAARCLLAGQTLFDQADTHPRGALVTSVPRAYYPATGWRADLELGAIELYLGTTAVGTRTPGLPHADPNFYLEPAGDWANAYISARSSGQDSLNLYDVSTLAHADLIRVLRTPQAQQYVLHGPAWVNIPTDAPTLLADRHDQLALATQLARRDPFGLSDPATPADTVAHALGYAIEGRLYDALSNRGTFEALGQQELGWALGANAWGSSFIVGVGSVFPHCLASQIANLSGSLNGRGRILAGAVVDGPTGLGNLTGLGAPYGYRPCPPDRTSDPYRAQSGRGMGYLDDVRSAATSEPSDDTAALALLAAAQQAAGG